MLSIIVEETYSEIFLRYSIRVEKELGPAPVEYFT